MGTSQHGLYGDNVQEMDFFVGKWQEGTCAHQHWPSNKSVSTLNLPESPLPHGMGRFRKQAHSHLLLECRIWGTSSERDFCNGSQRNVHLLGLTGMPGARNIISVTGPSFLLSGKLLAAIDDLGLRNRTLVHFTSDHGGHLEQRVGHVQAGGWNGIFKGEEPRSCLGCPWV